MNDKLIERGMKLIEEIAPACINPLPHIVEARRSAMERLLTSLAETEEDWPLKARVWTRTSVEPHEKVLEIEGTIGDTFMTCRHTQSLVISDEDVPGLPELYATENGNAK